MNGVHLMADCHGCRGNLINLDIIRDLCNNAVIDSGLTIVTQAWHKFPGDQSGVTGAVVLAESHLAIHTWPEIGKTTLDIYVCNYSKDNSLNAEQVLLTIINYLSPEVTERYTINRGM